MHTKVLQVDPLDPDEAAIAQAADVIRRGGLVAFPTETVYGLGANAFDARAVERIFVAKGRPATNPLIVHVHALDQVRQLASQWPEAAQRLSARFWPGPLSLVLPKQSALPDLVTAGGPTVALRMPAHPVAERLLGAAGVPIAAPSANRSTGVSATSAAHVLRWLDRRIDLVLDGGTTPRGIESTVLDLTVSPPRILRPGVIGPAELGEALDGEVVACDPAALQPAGLLPRDEKVPARSPGQMSRHYAPGVPVECRSEDAEARVKELAEAGRRVGWLKLGACDSYHLPGVECIAMPAEAAAYATRLYAALHRFEELGVERIVLDLPPVGEAWLAIHDRLRRASFGL